VTVETNPLRAGKVLYLQRYYGGRWTTIGSVRTDASGRSRATFTQRLRGYVSYRWYGSTDALSTFGIGNTVRVYVH
jgi:hypothetical protein